MQELTELHTGFHGCIVYIIFFKTTAQLEHHDLDTYLANDKSIP